MKTEELKYKLRHVSGLMDLAYFYDGQVDDPLYYDRWSGRLEKIADKLIESYAQQIREEDKLPINFWTRLKEFIEDVQVNDPASEEEKGMIVHVCNEFTKKQ